MILRFMGQLYRHGLLDDLVVTLCLGELLARNQVGTWKKIIK
jgi:hypothetical protein